MAEPRPLPPADTAGPERANVRPLREPAPAPQPPAEPQRAAETAAASEPSPKRPRNPRRLVFLLLGPLVLLAAGLYAYLAGGRYVSTDNAYVRADKLTVTTDVSGIVAAVPVRDGERVAKGQVLFRLDDEPYRIALAGAEAQLGAVRNELAGLQATYRQTLAQIEQARSDLPLAENNFARQQDLARRGAATQTALDQARRDLSAARERVIVAQRQAEAALAQLGGSAEAPIEANPRYRQAQAQVDRARRDLGRTVVTAPMAGVVANVDALQVGAYLPASQAAFSLVATEHVWVEANPKETDLTYLKAGDPALVSVDAYPDREWRATVASISPASGAEFSVLPPQNASGNWVKVVQRVPVRLRVEVPPDAPPLRAGMSANVSIDTGHKRELRHLLESLRRLVGV